MIRKCKEFLGELQFCIKEVNSNDSPETTTEQGFIIDVLKDAYAYVEEINSSEVFNKASLSKSFFSQLKVLIESLEGEKNPVTADQLKEYLETGDESLLKTEKELVVAENEENIDITLKSVPGLIAEIEIANGSTMGSKDSVEKATKLFVRKLKTLPEIDRISDLRIFESMITRSQSYKKESDYIMPATDIIAMVKALLED